MSAYAITAVRFNDHRPDRVEQVRWGEVHTEDKEWPSPSLPVIVPVMDVVDAIRRGDQVFPVFPVQAHTVLGPRVRTIVYEVGNEGIEVENLQDNAGRTLFDLPRL
jgi:hypothetical protein